MLCYWPGFVFRCSFEFHVAGAINGKNFNDNVTAFYTNFLTFYRIARQGWFTTVVYS